MPGTQLQATVNTFVGRTDLNLFLGKLPAASGDCSVDGSRELSAADWLLANTAGRRVLMFNENHYFPEARVFVRSMLPQLRKAGFTHIGFETFYPPWKETAPYTPASGYYSIEPVFAAMIRDANALGFTVFGYEHVAADEVTSADERQVRREQGEADNIRRIIREAPPDSRFVVFAGWGHIWEKESHDFEGPPQKLMAGRFAADSGLDPLTVDLTSCGNIVGSGHSLTARVYLEADGAVRVHGSYAGNVDAQIRLSVPSAENPQRVGYFRRALGYAVKIPAKLHPGGTTVLVEARRVDQEPADVAFDRVLLGPGEDFPIYLPPGSYVLTSHQTNGQPVGSVRRRVR
jgi:hypothetical protein